MLWFAGIRSKLEYASVAWNTVTIAYSSTLESIKRQIAALSLSRFYRAIQYHYDDLLEKLSL
jgi:hypothetical protein